MFSGVSLILRHQPLQVGDHVDIDNQKFEITKMLLFTTKMVDAATLLCFEQSLFSVFNFAFSLSARALFDLIVLFIYFCYFL